MILTEIIIFILLHFIVTVGLSLLILFIIYFLNHPAPAMEKTIAYECGFKPFDFAYYPFDVQFYRISILFLLFDVEIIFLFPWFLNLYNISWIGHVISYVFVVILSVGLVYENRIGALNWYPQPW